MRSVNTKMQRSYIVVYTLAMHRIARYHVDHLVVYTDASKTINGRESAAFFIPTLKVEYNARITYVSFLNAYLFEIGKHPNCLCIHCKVPETVDHSLPAKMH